MIALEWNGLEELVGAERARAVVDFKSTDHYTVLYKTVIGNRAKTESILRRYGIHW